MVKSEPYYFAIESGEEVDSDSKIDDRFSMNFSKSSPNGDAKLLNVVTNF